MADCLLGNVNDNFKGMCVRIINFFISKGLTPNQALGICANVYKESTYNPTSENKTSKAYGLFQWSPEPSAMRRQPFEAFCQKYNNGIISDPDIQLRYCWEENYRNFRNYYLSHKEMTAYQSLIWWQNNWEICDIPSTAKDECDTKTRKTELHRLEELYKSNVKTTNCGVTIGSSSESSTAETVCPPTTVSGADSLNEGAGSSGSDSSNSYGSSGSNEGESYGSTSITKPVLFGGTWAYFMTPYFCKNGDCLSYAQVWQNPDIDKSDKKYKYFGELGSQKETERKSTLNTIKEYLSQNAAPSYIVVSIDLSGEWRLIQDMETTSFTTTDSRMPNLIRQTLKEKLIRFFKQINHRKVFIPLLVKSYRDEMVFCKVKDRSGNEKTYYVTSSDLNGAIVSASKGFKNIKTLSPRTVPLTPYMPPSGGYGSYFTQEQWDIYAKNVQTQLLSNLKN